MAAMAHVNMSKARPEGRALLAFSLIEMVVVLVIMVVIAAIAVPRYAEADARYRLEGAARRIQSDVALARSSARADGLARRMSFVAATGEYEVTSEGAGAVAGVAKYRVGLSESPYRTTMSLPLSATRFTFVIDGRGEIAENGVITLYLGDSRITVTIGAIVSVSAIDVAKASGLDIPVDTIPPSAEATK